MESRKLSLPSQHGVHVLLCHPNKPISLVRRITHSRHSWTDRLIEGDLMLPKSTPSRRRSSPKPHPIHRLPCPLTKTPSCSPAYRISCQRLQSLQSPAAQSRTPHFASGQTKESASVAPTSSGPDTVAPICFRHARLRGSCRRA